MMKKDVEFIDVKINEDVIFSASSLHYLLQSMTNTDTNDVDATVQQVEELVNAGKIIRPAYKSVAKQKPYIPLKDRG